jgi:hypothetical protein
MESLCNNVGCNNVGTVAPQNRWSAIFWLSRRIRPRFLRDRPLELRNLIEQSELRIP